MAREHALSPIEVSQLADQSGWSADTRGRALELVTSPPGWESWRTYLDWTLLAFGSLALFSGLVFFIAANWELFGSAGKFWLLDILLAGSALLSYRIGWESQAGRWALTVAAGLAGTLLALYGQTYQTGADPWTMFLAWAALITPWCLLLDFAPLWGLWLVVLNVALALYFQDGQASTVLGTCNGLLWFFSRLSRFRLGWPPLALALALIPLTGSTCLVALGESRHSEAALCWLALLALALPLARRRLSKGELAGLGMSVVLVISSLVARVLDWDGPASMLLMGLVLVAQIAALIFALSRSRRDSD